ncbi:hypothetical protein ABH920_006772 [Catenulispora sp. EB89]|uniref:choice-of-anchor P family protein n=1 Tax=Catenulispora sp. EB89 TaxID=3156257 RepID=UPI003515147C
MRAHQRGLTPRGWGIAAAGTVVCAAGLALCLGGTTAAQAAPAAVAGGAFGVAADVSLAGVHVSVPAGPAVTLPSPGGSATTITGHAVGLGVGALASLGVLDVSTVGTPPGGSVHSTAEVQGLRVDAVLGGDDSALHGQENAIKSQCTATGSGASASTDLLHVVIAGQTVAANPAPNTHITVPGIADVVLNEQTQTGSAGSPGVTVNGVHIRLLPGLGALGGGDIYLAQSRCSITGGTGMPVGAVGGVVLTGVLGVLFTGYQFRKRRSNRGSSGGASGGGSGFGGGIGDVGDGAGA